MKYKNFEFFNNDTELIGIYNELIRQLEILPKMTIKKRNTFDHMVVLCNRRNFAYLSLLDSEGVFMSEGFRIIFGLNHIISDNRIQAVTEPHAGRFSHHVTIKTINDIDGQLLEWLKKAYETAK